MTIETRSAVKSADRILEIFEILAQRGEGLSHQALADALGIPKSSLTQLLKTALARGFVSYASSDRRYRLGERLFSIARSAAHNQDLIALSLPILEELTARSRESCALNVLKGDDTEVVATVNGPERLVTHMRLGDRAPLYTTSGGKIILAHMPRKFQEEYLEKTAYERLNPNTIDNAKELRRTIETAKRSGIAFSFEEFTPGIVGLARVVLSRSGDVLASINVAMPAVRYDDEQRDKISELLRDACNELQRLINL
jgi:DNA-binding IclR family transcriptional regulator